MDKMKVLVNELNEANKAYYEEGHEIMSNFEYDEKMDLLKKLEQESGIILENSPSKNVGHSPLKGESEEHEYPALSLDKTKAPSDVITWARNHDTLLSWKLDGQTLVVTYDNGILSKLLTRGNGHVGTVITSIASAIKGLPMTIPHMGHVVVRGEGTISYSKFEEINSTLSDEDKYKNPRNLASGTTKLTDIEEIKRRGVTFNAFELVAGENLPDSYMDRLACLESWGFNCVDSVLITQDKLNNIQDFIEQWSDIENLVKNSLWEKDVPVDGLVFCFDSVSYGQSLGSTSKFPLSGLAFKWQDAEVETTILDVFWSASKTGLLNPVAIFEPVELEGTTVQKASVHNVSIAKRLKLAPGSKVMVYKANMIIPQISKNVYNNGETVIPHKCPVCGGKVENIVGKDGSESLYCVNPHCIAKKIGDFSRFVSKDGMNIEGLAEKQLEQLINNGILKSYISLFELNKEDYDLISHLDGWGEKSAYNLQNSISKSMQVKFNNFLYALGIVNVGTDVAKRIAKALTIKEFILRLDSNSIDFTDIEGIGDVVNSNICSWFHNEENYNVFTKLLQLVEIIDVVAPINKESAIKDMSFVITGTVNHFANRDALKAFIEERGGKVSGSVSSKTSYLINNDVTSTSGKNKKALELGVSIISEEQFLQMAN